MNSVQWLNAGDGLQVLQGCVSELFFKQIR